MKKESTIDELFDQQDELLRQEESLVGEDYVNRMTRWELCTKRNKIGVEIGERIAEEFKTWVFRSWNRSGYERLRRGEPPDPLGLVQAY
jgi:hypothetical protein